jgi:hypothetical protein
MRKILILILLSLTISSLDVLAQIDTINRSNKKLLIHQFRPGLKQYLVYYQNPSNDKALKFWFWVRDSKKELINGVPIFSMTQHWYGSDSSNYRSAYSINRLSDFAPLYHSEEIRGKTSAFIWSDKGIIGDPKVLDNEKKDFKLDFQTPNFNWNLDIETFEMLPLAAGKRFAINFYDAGKGMPKYVLYRVSGHEVISTLDGNRVDCWILINENTSSPQKSTQRFWISKKGHELLKEEDEQNGTFRYKIKIIGAAPNLITRFSLIK